MDLNLLLIIISSCQVWEQSCSKVQSVAQSDVNIDPRVGKPNIYTLVHAVSLGHDVYLKRFPMCNFRCYCRFLLMERARFAHAVPRTPNLGGCERVNMRARKQIKAVKGTARYGIED